MPRLIDDLRATGKVAMPYYVLPRLRQAWLDYAERVSEAAGDPDLPVLLIDNVAEYFYSGTDQEYWSLDKDFPNLAPPFRSFWCEFKMVRTIHSKRRRYRRKPMASAGRARRAIVLCDRSIGGERRRHPRKLPLDLLVRYVGRLRAPGSRSGRPAWRGMDLRRCGGPRDRQPLHAVLRR